MARVKLSAILSEISGSVGAATFQKNQCGTILRNKPVPRTFFTQESYYSKLFVQLAQQAWAALSSSEQESWNSFLNYNPSFQRKNSNILLSGFNLFLRYNLLRQRIGQSILSSFTYSPLLAVDLTPTIGYAGGVLYLNFTTAFRNDVSVILFKISPVLKNPGPSYRTKLKVLPISSFTPPGVLQYNIMSTYYDKFGVLPLAGESVLCGVTLISAVAPIVNKEMYFPVTVT
jgi:hypothetical protein